MYYVYILTNWNNKVLYVGVTNDIKRRVKEHTLGVNESFTKKYKVNKLVYYKTVKDVSDAIKLEKIIKGWKREKKIALIEKENPQWINLLNC